MYQMREAFPSKLTREKLFVFFAEFSVRLSKSGPHFNLTKANECILSFIRTDLGLDSGKNDYKIELQIAKEKRLHSLVWLSLEPEISGLDDSGLDLTSMILRVFSVRIYRIIVLLPFNLCINAHIGRRCFM